MFSVRDGQLWFDERKLGPSGGLYVDHGELPTLTEKQGVVHLSMPARIDMAFVAGTRVVGCEAKRPSDFVGSVYARRLQRQVRTLLANVNVACVILRGGVPSFDDPFTLKLLVELQALGVVLLPCPKSDADTLAMLAMYRPVLADGSRAALAAIAGTDKKREPGSLLRAVKGIGPQKEHDLRVRYGSALGAFTKLVEATEDERKEAKVSQKVLDEIRRLAI